MEYFKCKYFQACIFLGIFFISLFFAATAYSANSSCTEVISANLRPGVTEPAVTDLQKFLNADPDTQVAQSGPGSPGNESMLFGPLTQNAVKKFQKKYASQILAPLGLSEGTGIIGVYTRAKIKEICSALAHAPNITSQDKIINKAARLYIGKGGWLSFLIALILVWGLNFIFWGFVSFIRVITEKIKKLIRNISKKRPEEIAIKVNDVAVMVPAHNEELVIGNTLISLSNLIKPSNIFVVSDGSTDCTAEVARMYGINVLELNPGRGKAGALETGIKYFEIAQKYKAVILVDADTRLKQNYLTKALPYFNDPRIVAVAGYASTIWNPKKMSWRQLLFVSHREKVYFLNQRLIKFGQTWKYTNVTPIVPGFASIYKTSILDKVNINPPGLVIEDFNMTFEIHHKKLGEIAHHPDVVAYTQDPDNLKDYFRQVRRWHLGFWQTIRLHGFWFGKFWAAMILTLAEVILGSLAFLILPFLLVASLVQSNIFLLPWWPEFLKWQNLLFGFFIGIWLSDYILTIIVAICQKRKEYLLVGIFFPLVRVLDAWAFLSGIPKTFITKSNGQWISPTRRAN
jgi:cellulose synthase/poly-beta-1,6-N-acetylglucosamine synthase-like glycosyltransferase